MTTSLFRPLQPSYSLTQQPSGERTSYCTLHWRRGQLLVKFSGKLKQPYLPALENQQLLVNCLEHSPINLVSVDPKIGETWVKFWADACSQAHKPMFLCGSSENLLFKQNSQPWRWLLRLIDWMVALVMLLLLTPFMLLLVAILQTSSPESIFSREWYVGERGKLFRAIKFANTTKSRWICRYGLDNLPQLFNVLRGDMSLLSPHSWTLEAAVKLSLEEQRQFNQLPVITSSWEVPAESKLIVNNP
jgi:lipopolysaccharide/colanic/teichoic acid biosynthesis glycosyltransferase